jgi:hypothetical protein
MSGGFKMVKRSSWWIIFQNCFVAFCRRIPFPVSSVCLNYSYLHTHFNAISVFESSLTRKKQIGEK